MSLILYWLATALVLLFIAFVMPGVYIDGVIPALIATFVMGLVNVTIRPLLLLLTLPITVVTLGVFALVLNALLFMLVAWLVPGFEVAGFWSALLASIVLALMTTFLGMLESRWSRA